MSRSRLDAPANVRRPMRKPHQFLLPDGLLFIAGLVLWQVPSAHAAVAGATTAALVAAAAVGALIGIRFHRGRVLLLLAMLGAAGWVMSQWMPELDVTTRRAAFVMVAALLPLACGVI